ncbi:MAG: hypothetical protein MJE68_32205 [Proteobacteria bacterium]|nr:hypothetical protein [Pseudomonadota bacterium]
MPKTAPPCASRPTIIFNQVPTGHRMFTGSPQSIPIKTNTSMAFCHTAPQELTSFPVWAG